MFDDDQPAVDDAMDISPWRLDPSKFPQRLDLELHAETFELLEALSGRTGRSISELAAELLGKSLGDSIPD
jgi:hypothetical protein